MSCSPECHRPTPAQAHCSTCHKTFGGVHGFDRHRRKGACVDPVELGFHEINRVWRLTMAPETAERFNRRHTNNPRRKESEALTGEVGSPGNPNSSEGS